jgi:putative nucleotidyltransferase with HDIG domain
VDTDTQKQEIRRRLEGARNLPTLPGVVARLLEMVDSPETTGRQLGLELAKDQVLSAKILKLVNSGFYGFSQPISTIPHAVTMLGFETVKSLVVGSSVLEMMEEALPGLWEHSLACARTGTLIAQHIELAQPEEVSVIGLLHDLGKVLLFQCFADEFQRVRTLVDDKGMLFSDAEQAVMGVNHGEMAGWLLEKWTLPPKLVDPITNHHDFRPAAIGGDGVALSRHIGQ